MAKYDVTKDNKLDKVELGNLLQDLSGGEKPTNEEIEWILITSDRSDNKIDNAVGLNEIEYAVDLWKSYIGVKPEFDKIFNQYDKDHTGQLNFDELKSLLKDLNSGIEPTDQEVQMVMDMADGAVLNKSGGISRTELQGAIAIWYSYTEDSKKKGCCTIL
ncbi:hypothetical protein GUITHDRAFT_137946 [Guillardia theta CCMP2712]|uniref:EF-hand domain-containing protein n=1 Tax=Guillardia theta (strain CCMP2712) TaxID=905079 RepID=L1JF92_GUITC|nr:hypothetical protein GUITHDRAFT_137946 [Guillardia theta CCMP2712]EKX46982.1 hypothetical protein GUITHDRAFT_137946 [Guillardia theta CCMP2712]|eukprot:XP_005833962.1 hypothetical protein GUITHDRAFT_137946 [Guillardia theta CCMP2712]